MGCRFSNAVCKKAIFESAHILEKSNVKFDQSVAMNKDQIINMRKNLNTISLEVKNNSYLKLII